MLAHDAISGAFASLAEAQGRLRDIMSEALIRLDTLPTTTDEVAVLVRELGAVKRLEKEYFQRWPKACAYQTDPLAKEFYSRLYARRTAAIDGLSNYGLALIEAGT